MNYCVGLNNRNNDIQNNRKHSLFELQLVENMNFEKMTKLETCVFVKVY